ncbi:MAG: NitT/TauT family transport system permease protein [Hyphomicrobiales bacterium]|nr:NitT/TauT family transport system permease protein [Hyphomicrobiales bacterium]
MANSASLPFYIRRAPEITGVGALVVAVLAFEFLVRIGVVNRYVIPPPSDVLLAFERVIVEEDILQRCRETAFEMLVAGVAVVLVGVPVGALLYRFALWRRALEDWVAALAAAPIVLAFPLFLVIFGRSPTTIIVMAFFHGLAPIILKTVEGLTATRKVLVNVGRSLNMTSSQMFWKILFPSALPVIFTGIRLSWTFCLITVVGVEFLINLGGLGQLINDLAERYDLPGTYASICFVILVSVIFFVILERIESWLQPAR